MKKDKDLFYVIDGYSPKYDPKPDFKRIRGKSWVPYGSHTNEYARYLIDLVQNSETHGSIISTKAKMIAGDKIIASDTTTQNFIDNINNHESLEDLIYKFAWDLEVFGSYNINVIWNRTHKMISQLFHLDASKILYGVKDFNTRQINEYYYSEDWSKYRQDEFKPKVINSFLTSKENSELINHRPSYQAGTNYYTYPDYVAGIKSIENDIKIVDFHLSNIDNNFQPGKLIVFIGDPPSDEEKERIREQLEYKHSGALNAGKTMIAYVNSKDEAPLIQTVPNERLDKMYDTLSEAIRNRILFAHGITSPLLVGIRTPGSLGGGEELEVAKDLFYKYRILPKRNYILKKINSILKFNSMGEITIEDDNDKKDDKKDVEKQSKFQDEYKEWVCHFNEDTCEWCKRLHGKKVKIGEPFKQDGYEIMGPDTNHKGCNCTIKYS